MKKEKNAVSYDANGARKVMRKRDYFADASGQLALGIMANLVGQLNYFYTDKVGIAVGSVGIVFVISKIIDAFTDLIVGNIMDHAKGGDHKYFKWIAPLMLPCALSVFLIFTVPIQAGQLPAVIYALVTNLLLTAVFYTLIGTPYGAVMIVRTKSINERNNIGLFRAVASYGSGTIIAVATIPITNILGGTQSAWIKYGAILALGILLLWLICWNNGRKAKFACDYEEEKEDGEENQDSSVPFWDAIKMLFRNKYWVIVLLFNMITSITNGIVAASGTYYSKWIFGNDNLVAITGMFGMLATVVGFILSKPIIAKLGVRNTVLAGLLGASLTAGVKCFAPTNFTVHVAMSLLGNFVQIPMMCLYGVLTAMAVDYNEWKYDNRLIAMSASAIGVGTKIGGGLGSAILAAFLSIGAYDATLEVATTSMRYAIYGFSNYLPLIINFIMFLIFLKFDLEKKLPQIQKEIAERKAAKNK